jgi:hypothetical protein
MAEEGKAGALIRRAEEFGLRLSYRSGFLIVTRPTPAGEDLVEMGEAIIEHLGKRLAEVRASVIAMARFSRGQEFIGERVFIPFIGIGERTKEKSEGRETRFHIAGKLVACSDEGTLTVSYVETRGDDEPLKCTTMCAFDEAFIVVGSSNQPDRASSFASIHSENLRRVLERGQSIGLTLELDAGFAVAKCNVATGDKDAGETVLRELGHPAGDLFRVLEGRARGEGGREFIGQQAFVPALESFGVIRSCDLDGSLDVAYEDKHLVSRLTCRCSGNDLLVVLDADEEATRPADPKSAPARNWFSRAVGW